MVDIAAMKTRMEARLTELDVRLHEIEDELDNPVSKNWDEAAIEREDDEVLEGIGKSGLMEAKAIKAALGRIEEGTYGECANCGEPISDDRLEVVPYAALCRKCAS